jgi:hypothetical protein
MLNVLAGVGAAQAVSMVVSLMRTKRPAVLPGPGRVGMTSVIDQTALIVLQVSALSLRYRSWWPVRRHGGPSA